MAVIISDSSLIQRYRPDIDGLRALAILAVMAFHAFPDMVRGGFVGVDVFFVISGFLISGIVLDHLKSNDFSFIDFYKRRIKRLLPALLTVLLFCGGAGWIILSPEEYKQLGKHLAGGAGFISNFVLWTEAGYFDKFSESKPLLHLWSLGIEEQFYMIWPLLLVLLWRCRWPLLPLIFILGLISFGLNIYLIHQHTALTFYLPFTRFWELLAGALLAQNARRSQPLFNHLPAALKHLEAALGLSLVLLAIVWLKKDFSFPGWWAALPVAGTALLIHAGPITLLHRKVLAHPLLVAIGTISYPLYLWHWPLLTGLRLMDIDPPSVYARSLALALSVGLAWLTYRYIEKPVRFGRFGTTAILRLLIVALVMIGGAGFAIYRSHGVPERFPEILRNFTAYTFDQQRDWRAASCYLYAEADHFENPEACIEAGRAPLVFLWGDSHAAALYPGLKQLQQTHNFRIAQLTASGCPPSLTWSLPQYQYCPRLNAATLDLIRQSKPQIVILHGNWPIGNEAPEKLELTLRELQHLGIPRIILIGPVPQWKDPLPRIIMTQWGHAVPHQMPPLYLRTGLSTSIPQFDQELQETARKFGIEYISPYHALCTEEGCLSRVEDETAPAPLMFDTDHLSPEGSRLLMHKLADQLFPIPTPLDKP